MPILMIGMRRSGSNLLRVMLNQAPGIIAPHPPHVLLRMMPLASAYGDLAQDGNFDRLVEDVCQLVELNPVAWDGVSLDRADIARRCRERSVVALFGAVYGAAADALGARDWVCKSLENIHYLSEIEAGFERPKYIYLYRDGRDVAVSMRKVVIGEKHMYHIAREWVRVQRLALEHRARIPIGRFLSISYEELTGRPEETIKRLCAFMEVPYSANMLDFHESDEAKRTAAGSSGLWGNVSRPIMTNNTRKFLREASAEDLEIFESVAGDVLDALGYERVVSRRQSLRSFTPEEIHRFDVENELLKRAALNGLETGERELRDRQDALLTQIRERHLPLTA